MLESLKRLVRVARRFAASGQLSPSPIPIIRRAMKGKKAFFIQVGSNDGQSGDPLHDLIVANPLWHGIFIEPVDYAFKKLVRTYGADKRFIFEQIAIADAPGERDFYFVTEDALQDPLTPPLSDKLGSFDRSHILKHSSTLEKYIASKKVRCEVLGAVLDKHKVDNIDIIHIDVEGYDYHVLRQIDFNRFKPRVILFEHAHLASNEYSESCALLRSHKYKIINCGLDTLATNENESFGPVSARRE